MIAYKKNKTEIWLCYIDLKLIELIVIYIYIHNDGFTS